MKSPILYATMLGVCLTFLTLSAGGRTTTGNATQGAASGSTMVPAGSSHKHHAMAHHETHAKHRHIGAGSAGSYQEEAYRNALKNCVAGAPSQRDGCLDDTIARFGRS